ncbi:hypothetical protein ABQG29_09040, partial [Xanthomonas nasturtii]
IRPWRLWRGIHAAQGPATVGGQGPVELVDAQRFQQAASKPRYAVFSFFNKGTSQLSGAVPSPIAGPLAAWMRPSS